MRASRCDAVLFDLDGVLTDTSAVHERAWRRLFTDLFSSYTAMDAGITPYSSGDYFTYIDGKPRAAGVSAVLASRRIELPVGQPDDGPTSLTVYGLGNKKNEMFLRMLGDDGARAYPGATEVLEWLDDHAIPKGVVSSSRNAEVVLRATGLLDKIDTVVDGISASEIGLAGKPAPDTYLCAAERLSARPARTVVVEDASSGVQAGRAGGFWVVGIDRGAGRQELLRNGADVVIDELCELFANDRMRQPSRPD